jgi:hypothetical protein
MIKNLYTIEKIIRGTRFYKGKKKKKKNISNLTSAIRFYIINMNKKNI